MSQLHIGAVSWVISFCVSSLSGIRSASLLLKKFSLTGSRCGMAWLEALLEIALTLSHSVCIQVERSAHRPNETKIGAHQLVVVGDHAQQKHP